MIKKIGWMRIFDCDQINGGLVSTKATCEEDWVGPYSKNEPMLW